MIEDFRIRIFLKVAECGSFTAAAKALSVSQPAVSQNIAELEKSLGARLFDRSRSNVVLTMKGREFLGLAESIAATYREASARFECPKSILIKDVLHEGRKTNILIVGKRFSAIDVPQDTSADKVIEAEGLAILPPFYNTHTHAAMTLLRGYGEDQPLSTWLSDYVWPYEDTLTPEDIRHGSEIAVGEMIDSGSVFFNDMYFEVEQTIELVAQAGLRAVIGLTMMDNHSKAATDAKVEMIKHWTDPTGGRIRLAVAPHAIYTVGAEKLKYSARLARENGLKLHIHVAETRQEVDDCLRDHGMTPVRYLDSLKVLGPDVIAAHCVYVDEEEWDILAKRGVTVSHCPCSNMKLGSGRFPYELALRSGCRITIGTDGASSNNNLDMREEMKFAALFAKSAGDTTLLPVDEVFRWATANGAEAFDIDAGVIAEGKLADAVLVDLNNPRMQPCHNLISNWAYSADSSCIRNVICDGRILK